MSTCRWCTPQHQSTIEFLQSYCSEQLSSQELKAANEDLCYCLECVVDYHRARDELPSVHKNLWKIETKRLVEHFEKALKEEEEEEDELFLIEDEQEIQLHGYMAADIENDLRVPIIEILKYPYLLLHERLSELYVEALIKMEQGNFSFQIFEKYPGIYLLLVHPNETIRKWAILAARSLGKVERDDFYDLQEVITCLLKVIELDLFENTDFYNSYGMEEGKLILLPPHLYDVTNHKNYWLGICMLLLVLDEQAMDSLLLAHDKQNDFMKSILNTMMKSKPGDASDPFWPALQCFMVILDRLGSKVWGHLIDPTEAFQTIIGSQSYNNEIEKIRNSRNNTKVKYDLDGDDDNDDVVSCSQIVYDYDVRKPIKDAGWKHTTCAEYYPSMYDEMQSLAQVLQCDVGQDMRVHNSTFLWFIPFVNSVMDLKDLGIAYIGEVVHHIYSEIKDVLNRKVNFCDKVTEFFILILVSIIELHRNKNYLHLLWYSSQKWVGALVKCANLPARVFNQNTERTAATSNFKVSSTVLAVNSASACSSITNSVQQSCVRLIRSFLREGCQSQQRSVFQQFLDRLNLQLRSTFILGWQLNLEEQQELQSCLTLLVKNAKYRTSELKQLGTVEKGSGQKFPSIKREKEDTGEWGKMPGYCNRGPGPPCSLIQPDNRSLIQKSVMNQEKLAVCTGQNDWPKRWSVGGEVPCKAQFSMCDDGAFFNETRANEVDVLKVGHTEELSSLTTRVEISPPPPSTPPIDKVIRADLPSRQEQALDQLGGLKRASVADVDFNVGSLPNDNLQAKPLEVTPSVNHKEKWKRSMLIEFQKSFSDNTTKPEAPSAINNQHVHSTVTCGPVAGDLHQKMKPVETLPRKFKIDQNVLFNLKAKMQAVDIKGKIMKENSSSSKERKLEESAMVEINSSRLDDINSRSGNRNIDFSKRSIAGSTSTEHETASPPQLSPFSDEREKPSNSNDIVLGPLSLDKANLSSAFKAPDLPNQSRQCTSEGSDSDDVPLSKLRAKLKRRILLTRDENTDDSTMNKDLGKPLEVTSVNGPNLSIDLSKELNKIQTLNKIDRKVKVSPHIQLCDSVQHKEKPKCELSMEEPTIDKDSEVVNISNSHSTKENNNMLEVERRETQNLVDTTSVVEIADSTEKNKTCLQETPISSKPSPTLFEEYDSQVFEFESEEQVYSVWEDVQPHEQKGENEEPEQNDESDVHTNSDDADINSMLNEWGYDTDYVPDELIEKVAEEVEAQLKEEITASKTDSEKQLLLGVKHISPCSSAGEGTSVSCSRLSFKSASNVHKEKQKYSKIARSNQNLSDISKRKLASAKNMPDVQPEKKQARKKITTGRGENTRTKNGIREKYLSQVSSRKGLNKFILSKQSTNGRLDQKAKTYSSNKTSETRSSQTSLANTSKYTKKNRQINLPLEKLPSTSSPRKVRKWPEPTSTVEKLSLKKKTRKALDLSQGSLDDLNKLRNYGQAIGTIENKHPKKAKLIAPQKLAIARNSRLLASQDRQYIRQSRTQRHHKEKKRISPSNENVFPKGALSSTERQDSSICVQTSQKLPSTSVENSSNCIAATVGSLKRKTSLSSTQEKLSSVNVSDDLNLTQHDPLDMDISGDENLEDDDLLMLTQRDPIDMDISSDTTEEEDSTIKPSNSNVTCCQHTGCTDAVASSEKFCKNHAASEPKADVFAKPGLPLSDLKSSRPSTAKCFASSSTSRNAQLATAMEVIPKRPAVAVSKVQQFQKPPAVKITVPESSRPIQPAKVAGTNILRTQNKDVNFRPKSSLPTAVSESHSMRESWPPGRSRQASCIDITDHHQRDQSYLINAVLKWNYQMFDMFNQFGAPDMLCEFPLREVPERFRSYEDYFTTFYPLLMLNLFEQLAQKLMESKQTNKMIHNSLMLKNYSVEGRVNRAVFQASLQDHELEKQLYPKEDDVVFLWLPQRHNYYMQDESEMNGVIPHIAHVSRTSRFSGRDSQTTLYLIIHTRGNVSAIENQPVRCDVIGSIVTTIRQFKGLLFLAKTLLIRPILSAHSSFFSERDIMENTKWNNANDYNVCQQKAINTVMSMVKQPRIPKVCLIQGPPGTGKSKTIVGLLHRLLNEDQENVKPSYSRNKRTKHARILVCAPSNAAIDDLMKKIIIDFKLKCKNMKNCLGNCGDVNLVRLGTEKAISPDVMGFSLDYQVNHRMKKEQIDADQTIQREKDCLDKKLDELGKQCAIIKKDREQIELANQERRRLERERAELGRKLKELQGRTQDIQLKIILESHIICCTLSTSGSVFLGMSFRKLGHEPFNCVIVDEAGQACETEILIPLMYRCPKLILVGDPEQLPPTIISMKAKELGYGRSMMCRLQKCLQGGVNQANCGHSPVLLLLTQYRMHPDICLFPSKYIYGNMLKTDENVEMERCRLNWPFQSYMLFDVTDGYEYKDKDSYANPQEVKLVIALISMIAEKQKGTCRNIGVITPYNAQKQEINRQIEQECKRARLEHARTVQVGTVDGFQGCEKDCIIVSCVRANSPQRSIGFLADRQRMNVTITRARLSLFILGHLKTLMEDKDWNALIQDAKKRGAIVKTCEREYKKDCQKVTKPRPTFHRNISDPGALTNEREPVPALKKLRSDSLNVKTTPDQLTDISGAQIPKWRIPSQPTALQQQCRPQASATVQPEASNAVTHPQTSVRSEQSSHSRHKDPRLARREALAKEVQLQLKSSQSLSKSSEVLPPDSSTSSGRHRTTHSSHFGQTPRNYVSRASVPSTSNTDLVFPSGASVCGSGKDTVYRLKNL